MIETASAVGSELGSDGFRDTLHEMAMDDLEELVPPGEEDRVPERARGELLARRGASGPRGPYPKYELTPERETIIRARYDGRTATIRDIADAIGVPWYTVRDWANQKLGLRNPSETQPTGAGNLVKRSTLQAAAKTAQRRDVNMGTFKPIKPDATEQSEIEAQREKRNALIANVSADDAVRSDTNPLAQGWPTPKWVYTDALGAVLAAHWDGSDTSLARIAENGRIPLGVLRGWITEHNITPGADPVTPVAPAPQAIEDPSDVATLECDIPATDYALIHEMVDQLPLDGRWPTATKRQRFYDMLLSALDFLVESDEDAEPQEVKR